MIRALVVLLALGGTALQAQESPFAGSWRLSYPIGMQMTNGMPTPILGTGVLTVEANSDSLIGTLVTDPDPDLPSRPPARLAAGLTTGEAVFTSYAAGKVNMSGQERDIDVVSTWTLKAAGDSISGTVSRQIEGFEGMGQEPQPVTGTRRK